MSGASLVGAVGIAVLAVSAAAQAGELTPEQIARVKHDEKAAMGEIAARHGNRLPSQMSSEERGQVIHEQAAASQGALEKNKVDPKDYARREATLSLDERKAVDEAAAKLDAEDAAKRSAAEAGKKKAEEEKEKDADDVVVQGGDNNPVDVYEDGDVPAVDNLSEPGADDASGGATAAGESVQSAAAKEAPGKKAPKAAAKHGKRHRR